MQSCGPPGIEFKTTAVESWPERATSQLPTCSDAMQPKSCSLY